jgi:hypothetical protein
LQPLTAYTRGMRNLLLLIGLVAVIVLAVVWFWNPFFYFFGGTVNAQLLSLLVLIPLAVGLIVGFGLGWSRGRGSVRVKA